MFGFPIGNGNAGFNDFVEKFTNNADSGFPKIQQREVFYSVKDGNWNDTTMWQTASGKVGILPTANDDVYIRHIMTMNAANQQCNNMFVSGTFKTDLTARGISIFGNFLCDGILDLSANNTNHTMFLYGLENRIQTYITGTGSIIHYARGGDQKIIDIVYRNLTIGGWGVKSPVANLVINGNLNINNTILSLATISYFDTLCYDLVVNGTTTINALNAAIQSAVFRKTGGGGNILFVGAVTLGFRGVLPLDFSIGNPNVECRGGVVLNQNNLNNIGILSGTGTWSFTTNNQSITDASGASGGSYFVLDGNIAISPGITLTIGTSGTNFPTITCNGTINGQDSTSNLINKGIITFTNQIAAESCMTTGIYDFGSNTNTIQYAGNYLATIPSYFTNFHNLTISGTGTKTLSVNTTLNGNLAMGNPGVFELSTYNLTVTGTTTLNNSTANQTIIQKSGAGNVLFIGNVAISNNAKIDFTIGNPNVEFRNGISFAQANLFLTGTGNYSFTTNNQEIGLTVYGSTFILNGSSTTVAAGITLTVGTNLNLYVTANTFTGASSTSTIINKGNIVFTSPTNLSIPTGVFNITSNANTVGYSFNGNCNIPYTSFHGLSITGTGTKSITGNTTLNGNLFVQDGIFELSTYDFTVNGTTTHYTNGRTSKTGAGNVLFVGQLGLNQNGSNLIFTGNPTVECRGGFISSQGTLNIGTGTGVWSFTTNNQSIVAGVSSTFYFSCPMSIATGITLNIGNGTNTVIVYSTNTINGESSTSTLRMTALSTFVHQNATQPMATGILDTSTNLNTWIYGNSNQDIKGNTTAGQFQQYRNLTLNGGGTKTLQGNINVQNTYTLTAPATINLNGYTKTP